MARADILKPFILSFEGGFVNDPDDKGGATNKGVTIATFRGVFGKTATVEQLKRITDAQWLTIFNKHYWGRWLADRIEDQSIANTLVDWVWASGAYGIKIPQRILGVVQDGIVGPKTLAALNDYPDQRELFEKLQTARHQYIDDIIKRTPINAKFRKGWLRRIDNIRYGKLIYNNGQTVTF